MTSDVSFQDPQENNIVTVVAVSKGKNSAFAVRWAIDNLLQPKQPLILLHVRTRHHHAHGQHGGNAEANSGLTEDIFAPCRACCAHKGAKGEELIIEGVDVHSALIDYINHNSVTNIVLGASTRNVITRFWIPDVSTMINKAAPDFCSVYVISRGKAQSIRPAARLTDSSIRLPSAFSSARSSRAESDDLNRTSTSSLREERKSNGDEHQESISRRFKNDFGDSKRRSRTTSKYVHRDEDSMAAGIRDQAMDITRVQIHAETGDMGLDQMSDLGLNSLSPTSIHRLKHEVNQTMNMYNEACKEAVSAQKKVNELQQMKQGEMDRFEQARLSEEAALALVEMEKAKCRAAIEAAEKAQKIAEKETQRRKYAEQRAKREAEEKNRALDVLSNNDDRYRKYTIEEIEVATNNFSGSMKIGEGGYGPVYKGKLDHTAVAIKVLRPDAAQGRKQFQQEVEVLTCMRHPNMVLLMGACPEYGCLVYEYMNNGSLEDCLYRKGNTPPIPWGIRFKIAADIATGLLFLHQAKPEPLVHRDLKPGNILLDHHYTCKISDVGLARLVPPAIADSVTQYHMTSAAGTFCYIDPEYQQTGKLGTKSDIYSLGVILLQIITARPPMGLTHHVERAIDQGTFADLLDPTVPDWPVEEALGFAKLALKCTELRKKDRPDLGKEILPNLNRLQEFGMQHGLGRRISY
ncbi:kinase with adenine nucleotide alpha hydrolases-like domain-containing protein [Perilla frutescens var. hirtella]|nr:kinase with adenine nucleotide alpha hydrolases-like domain-containing protein [Perilla frutescens var. frutescens]KAH6783008.1 kinase with adenine nucleotide alpha hydrolases-like domain-containing protein [Perilla frutescens var. hirtella]